MYMSNLKAKANGLCSGESSCLSFATRKRIPAQLGWHRSSNSVFQNRNSLAFSPVKAAVSPPLPKDAWQKEKAASQPLPPPPASATIGQVLPYLLKLALDEKHLLWRLALFLLLMTVARASGLACPLIWKHAVDTLGNCSGDAFTLVGRVLIMYAAADALKNLCRESLSPVFTPVAQAVSRRVAYHTFSHVLHLDMSYHLDRQSGRLTRVLERGPRSVQMLFRVFLFLFIPTCVELAVVCGVLANQFSAATASCAVATFATYIIWSMVMTQVATKARERVTELDTRTSAKAVDALLNYETVSLFTNQKLEVSQYDVYLREYQAAVTYTDVLASTLNIGQALILGVGLLGVLLCVLASGGVVAGDLVLIQGLLLQVWSPLQFLGFFYRELRTALVDLQDFFAILGTKSKIVDGTAALPANPPTHLIPAVISSVAMPERPSTSSAPVVHEFRESRARSVQGQEGETGVSGRAANGNGASYSAGAFTGRGVSVELQNVEFKYESGRQVLYGVTLTAQPGQSLAVVGSSGSGKSTLLKLVTRLYDVTGGRILINGADVRDLSQGRLLDSVAVVPQDTVLFNDSIMSNVRYGRPSATDEEVIAACHAAHLHETVMAMPLGYESVVGERGLKLSGGEKQRVAIARAFLRAPRLLICDEATSALDSETESQIMTSLAELAEGRTSIFVAHRLSTIRHCDQIVVLDAGVVVESGRHDELVAAGGRYAQMWERQAAQGSDTRGSIEGDMSGEEDGVEFGDAVGDSRDNAWGGSMAVEQELELVATAPSKD